MIRLPTITTLLSLVTLFSLTSNRAIASDKTESVTAEKEESLTPQLNSDNSIFSQPDKIKSKQEQKQKNKSFLIPFTPRNSRFFTKPAQPELFSKPYYSGSPQKRENQKKILQGSRGAEVWAVQRRLQARGFNPGAVDSIFGARTTKAVKAFQESVGLTVTGIVDELTWTSLAKPSFSSRPPIQIAKIPTLKQKQVVKVEKILAKGDRGSKVKTLQIGLGTMGFNPGPIDGIFGSKTTGAVKEFQKSKGIKADGIVDQKTWKAFNQK
ncbi:MAG: peptidoglycan-binding protein [Trichodesmium sp. St11_bin5]|nr:peptidoglycan-binding protein [Trichodesmium sp. St11_bin5]